MIYNWNLFSQLFLFSRFKVILHLLQIFFYLVNLVFDFSILDFEFLQKSKQILWLKNSITVLVEKTEDPEVYEFNVAIGSILNQRAELPESETLRETKKMEKSV